jgi:cytochrome c-type biogenesis protein CcmH
MMLFWLICALFIVIAFAFVLPTALQRNDQSQQTDAEERKLANIAIYRDQLSELEADLQNGIVSQEQYAQDREEIERRLLEDTAAASPATAKTATATVPPASRSTAYAIAFGLPIVAVIFYFQVGNPDSITQRPRPVAAAPSAAGGERTEEQIEANVAALAKRLQANPNDAQGWTMLARSYNSMERFGEAAGAYAKATELKPDDADLWAEYAFVSAMANNQSLEGRPMELVKQALKVDPQNAKALQLAGSAAFQAKDYAEAVEYWQKVLKQVPANSEVAQTIQERIDEAKSLAGAKQSGSK